MTLETFKDRLIFLVDSLAAGKHTVFAKKCGIPAGTFQAYVDHGTIPKGEQLIKISSPYRINLNWLLMGEGEPFVQDGPCAYEQIGERGFDEQLLREVIIAVEEWLNSRGLTLVPGRKADLILELYDRISKEGGGVNKEAVSEVFLKLVA